MRFALLATCAAAALATPAVAADVMLFDLGPISAGAYGNLNPTTGAFSDVFTFTVPNGLVDATIGTFGFSFLGTNLTFSSVTLNGQSFNLFDSGAAAGGTLLNFPVLSGTQTLLVQGNAQRFATYGGTISFRGTPAAVPEPAAWAMMLGGFGLIGGAMRQRRIAVRTVSYAA